MIKRINIVADFLDRVFTFLNKHRFITLLIYRSILALFAVYVVSKITILGDYERYISKDFHVVLTYFSENPERFSNKFTDLFVSFIHYIFKNEGIVNLFFSSISSIAIYYLLISIGKNKYIFLLFLWPSFNFWSSYASKEAIAVTAVSIVLGSIVRLYKKETYKLFDLIYVFSIILFFPFYFYYKKVYSLVVLCIATYLLFKKIFDYLSLEKKYLKFLSIVVLLFFISAIIYYSDILFDEIIKHQLSYLHSNRDNSTREITDILLKVGKYPTILFGGFIAIMGPLPTEIFNNVLFFVSFIESWFFLFVIVFIIRKYFYIDILSKTVIFCLIYLLMIFHIPYGIYNPGSSIRYRSNLIPVLILLVLLFPLLSCDYDEEDRILKKIF